LRIFKMQKRAIRIVTGSKNRDSCRDLFKNLKILPFHSQHILSLLLFVVDNKSTYTLNSNIQSINIRQTFTLHQHSANLYRKRHSFHIKVFSSLPQSHLKKNLIILSNLKRHSNVTYLLLLLHKWMFQCKQTVTSINSKLKRIAKDITELFWIFADCGVYITN
jgi:hypothetical protein